MKLKELFETEFVFECVLNEVKYTFYKKYSNSEQKRILINFVCQMFQEHNLKDKGIEYEIRNSPNILPLNQLKSIFEALNKLHHVFDHLNVSVSIATRYFCHVKGLLSP